MIVQPIDWFLVAWFAVAVCCAAYVAYDQFKGNPEPAVMKWGFPMAEIKISAVRQMAGNFSE